MSAELAICAAFNYPIDPSIIKKVEKEIPDSTFGVFVTIRRSDVLPDWPTDIHGCIGNWSDGGMSKSAIIETTKSVAHSATWSDSRRKYFKTPVYRTPNTLCEVDYMLLPQYPVSNDGYFEKNGRKIKYDNNKYGLIATNNKGQRATYLRYVFENKPWEFIRNSLTRKANIQNNTQFFAYDSIILKEPIKSIMYNRRYWQHIFGISYNFLLKHYTEFVPYEYRNNKIIVNKSQYVRNVATLYDILQLEAFIDKRRLTNFIVSNINYYLVEFKENPLKMRQASAFLLLALKHLNMDTTIIKTYLINSLDDLEPAFERGEVLSALAQTLAQTNANKIILKEQEEKMFADILNKPLTKENVFQYNWHMHFLYYFPNKKHAKFIYDQTVKIMEMYPVEKWHTNYLAVTFEIFAHLTKFVELSKLEPYLFDLQYHLMQTFDSEKGLFKFSDGSMRLDMMGHVLNGVLVLMRMS